MDILRKYEAADSRIVVIAKENGGVSSARNAGLDRMTGEYVTFIDPDDFVHPQYFDLFLYAQTTTHAEFILGQYEKVTEDSIPEHYDHFVLEEGTLNTFGCEQLFRNAEYRRYCTIRLILSRQIEDLRFREDMQYGEDTTFIAELWEQNPQMTACAISLPVYYYFDRERSASQTTEEQRKIYMLTLFAGKINCSKQNELIYLDQVIRSSLSNRDLVRYIYIYPNRKIEKAYSALLRGQINTMLSSIVYSAKEKIAILAFIFFPSLHWLYRIAREPSLRDWQHMQLQKRGEIMSKHTIRRRKNT